MLVEDDSEFYMVYRKSNSTVRCIKHLFLYQEQLRLNVFLVILMHYSFGGNGQNPMLLTWSVSLMGTTIAIMSYACLVSIQLTLSFVA